MNRRHFLLILLVSGLCRVQSDVGKPFVIPTVVIPARPPDADTDKCADLTTRRGALPPDVELGPAEIIRGFQNFGDISLFRAAAEKLKRGATACSCT